MDSPNLADRRGPKPFAGRVPNVYRVRPLWADLASLDLPRVMPMTCGRGKPLVRESPKPCFASRGSAVRVLSTLKPAGQTSFVLALSVQNAHGSIKHRSTHSSQM